MNLLVQIIYCFAVFLALIGIGRWLTSKIVNYDFENEVKPFINLILGFTTYSFFASFQQILSIKVTYLNLIYIFFGIFVYFKMARSENDRWNRNSWLFNCALLVAMLFFSLHKAFEFANNIYML